MKWSVKEAALNAGKWFWYSDDGSWSLCARATIYLACIAAGICAVSWMAAQMECPSSWYANTFGGAYNKGPNLPTVVLATIFALILGLGQFFIKTSDDKLRFENDFEQRNEQEFSRAINLLADKGNSFAQSLGLRLLVNIRNQGGTSPARKGEIDHITSSSIVIKDAKLKGADLQNADLRGADLREADLRGADLRGAVLTMEYRQKVTMGEFNLQQANLNRAKYDSRTKFPGGFDPDVRGMHKVD